MILSFSPTIRNTKINLFIDNNNINEQRSQDLLLPIDQISSSSKQPYVKFLGVLLDPELTFKNHINHVSNQLSKGIYFLKTSKNFFTEFCLKNIYYTLIHSHLTYALTIWSCVSPGLLDSVVKKQKTAIRIVCNAKPNAHTQPLFKRLGILPFQKLTEYFNLTFMHSYQYKFLPSSFDNYWPTNRSVRNAQQNDLVLRNDNELYLPPCRLKSTEFFPFYRLPRIWRNFDNEFPNITFIRNKNEFKSKLKEHFLNQIPEDYRCERLFCHSCSPLP